MGQKAKVVPLWHRILFTERKLVVTFPNFNSSPDTGNQVKNMENVFFHPQVLTFKNPLDEISNLF